MARGLLGATLGGLSYVFYKQGSLELDEAELCVDGSGFKSAMAKYGACVLQQVVPLQKAQSDVPQVLQNITFQGRPLLSPSSRSLNLDVAGAAIGSALAMPLLFPGSFLAGALLGQSSGYVISMLQSMKQPTVSALLEVSCARTASIEPKRGPGSSGSLGPVRDSTPMS